MKRQPQNRMFMRFAGADFPWPSAIALLYPISAIVYICAWTPESPAVVVGYGLANLGYVLFAAGVWAGSFRALGLTKRWKVFGSAIAAFAVGTVFINVGV